MQLSTIVVELIHLKYDITTNKDLQLVSSSHCHIITPYFNQKTLLLLPFYATPATVTECMKIEFNTKSNYSRFLQKGVVNIPHIVHVKQQYKGAGSVLW